MTTKEKIEVMNAYEDGRLIEFKSTISNIWMKVDCTPDWDWANYDYRVAPTEKRIPLTYDDMLKRVREGKTMWICTDSTDCVKIVRFDLDKAEGLGSVYYYETLMEANMVFADGDTCWKEAANEAI